MNVHGHTQTHTHTHTHTHLSRAGGVVGALSLHIVLLISVRLQVLQTLRRPVHDLIRGLHEPEGHTHKYINIYQIYNSHRSYTNTYIILVLNICVCTPPHFLDLI